MVANPMINRIKALLEGGRDAEKGSDGIDETQLAAAVLLVEAARIAIARCLSLMGMSAPERM